MTTNGGVGLGAVVFLVQGLFGSTPILAHFGNIKAFFRREPVFRATITCMCASRSDYSQSASKIDMSHTRISYTVWYGFLSRFAFRLICGFPELRNVVSRYRRCLTVRSCRHTLSHNIPVAGHGGKAKAGSTPRQRGK